MKYTTAGLAAALLMLGTAAGAQEVGNPFKGQWSSDRSRRSVFIGGVGLTTPFEDASDFAGFPPGSSTDLKNAGTLGFAYNYSMNDHVELQVQLALPFEADLDSTGTFLSSAPTLGTIKILPPQAFVLYNFRPPTAAFRPFVGAGFGYLMVEDETPSAEALALAGPDTAFDVDGGFFPAITFGAERSLTDSLSARLQINYNVISVDTTLTSSALPAPVTQNVDVNPVLIALGLTYRF